MSLTKEFPRPVSDIWFPEKWLKGISDSSPWFAAALIGLAQRRTVRPVEVSNEEPEFKGCSREEIERELAYLEAKKLLMVQWRSPAWPLVYIDHEILEAPYRY